HRLLGRVERGGGNLRRLERGERLGGRALRGPLRHALGDDLAVVAARLVILEPGIAEPALLAHEPGPAGEHWIADRVGDDPAVPQSTQATAARSGCSGVPVRYAEPHIAWPTPSKPRLSLNGPPAPKAVTVVRMMSGFTRRRLSRSRASARSTSGGRLATTTSAVATSLRTISRPSGHAGSSVMARLLRFMTRYSAPTPSGATGATQRSSPPPRRSMRITSAPRSARSAAQYGPAMYRPKSRTRVPVRTPSRCPSCSVMGGAPHIW